MESTVGARFNPTSSPYAAKLPSHRMPASQSPQTTLKNVKHSPVTPSTPLSMINRMTQRTSPHLKHMEGTNPRLLSASKTRQSAPVSLDESNRLTQSSIRSMYSSGTMKENLAVSPSLFSDPNSEIVIPIKFVKKTKAPVEHKVPSSSMEEVMIPLKMRRIPKEPKVPISTPADSSVKDPYLEVAVNKLTTEFGSAMERIVETLSSQSSPSTEIAELTQRAAAAASSASASSAVAADAMHSAAKSISSAIESFGVQESASSVKISRLEMDVNQLQSQLNDMRNKSASNVNESELMALLEAKALTLKAEMTEECEKNRLHYEALKTELANLTNYTVFSGINNETTRLSEQIDALSSVVRLQSERGAQINEENKEMLGGFSTLITSLAKSSVSANPPAPIPPVQPQDINVNLLYPPVVPETTMHLHLPHSVSPPEQQTKSDALLDEQIFSLVTAALCDHISSRLAGPAASEPVPLAAAPSESQKEVKLLQERLAVVEERLERVGASDVSVELQKQLQELQRRVEDGLSGSAADLLALKTDTTEKLHLLEERVEEAVSLTEALGVRVDVLQGRVDRANGALDELKAAVELLQEEVAAVRNNNNFNVDVNSTIELLKSRIEAVEARKEGPPPVATPLSNSVSESVEDLEFKDTVLQLQARVESLQKLVMELQEKGNEQVNVLLHDVSMLSERLSSMPRSTDRTESSQLEESLEISGIQNETQGVLDSLLTEELDMTVTAQELMPKGYYASSFVRSRNKEADTSENSLLERMDNIDVEQLEEGEVLMDQSFKPGEIVLLRPIWGKSQKDA